MPFPAAPVPGGQGYPPPQGMPRPQEGYQPPIPPASGSGSGGLKASLADNSGIISTYEDMQRNENIKTRKIPLPSEKKKGFFDGLFRKDGK
jgi:hypothetical protein